MINYYQFIIPRLNGAEISQNFRHYRSFVHKGVAGFIVFGGQIGQIRKNGRKLQAFMRTGACCLLKRAEPVRGLRASIGHFY